jgi:hypothetical protein
MFLGVATRSIFTASTTVSSNEQGSEAAMRMTKLAIVLFAIGLAGRLSAQQPAVVVNLTEQTAYLLENRHTGESDRERQKCNACQESDSGHSTWKFSVCHSLFLMTGRCLGAARNLAGTKRAIPVVQSGRSRYATAFLFRAETERALGFQ